MKLLTVNHKGINYEFRLLEYAKVIQVTKDIDYPFAEVTYVMTWRRKGNKFCCGCPGSMFHGKCWHSEMVNSLCQQPSVNEPWTVLAEMIGNERVV